MTQYVYVNDTVTFECATNLTQLNFFFVTNPLVTSSKSTILLPNSKKISINLTAISQVNGTSFTCQAPDAGAMTESAYLYVQGEILIK